MSQARSPQPEPEFNLQRASLRDQILRELRQRVIRGQLPAGCRLVESELAKQLGVSRTPLREALIALEQEGFVEAAPGKGFTVQPLHEQGYEELRHILATLERLAMSICPVPSPEQIAELRRLNEELRATCALPEGHERAERRLQTDMLFHEMLLEPCPNRTLLDLLASLKRQWRRYEYAFWSVVTDERTSADQHDRVLDALAAGDVAQAAARLEDNWKCWKQIGGRWVGHDPHTPG